MRTLLIAIAAVHFFAFAAFHMRFWRMFRWQDELPKLSATNRAVMQLLNLAAIYFFLFLGATEMSFLRTLSEGRTALGAVLLGGAAGFWVLRAILQGTFFGLQAARSRILFVLFLIGGAANGAALIV